MAHRIGRSEEEEDEASQEGSSAVKWDFPIVVPRQLATGIPAAVIEGEIEAYHSPEDPVRLLRVVLLVPLPRLSLQRGALPIVVGRTLPLALRYAVRHL